MGAVLDVHAGSLAAPQLSVSSESGGDVPVTVCDEKGDVIRGEGVGEV